jgi:isoamylase/glycogen operon protein
MNISPGNPFPLGTSCTSEGVNFAFVSSPATQAEILLFYPDDPTPFFTATLTNTVHKTDSTWHAFIEPLTPPFEYVYRTYSPGSEWSPPLLDPYAKGLTSDIHWMTNVPYTPKARCFSPPPFDWQNIPKPPTPTEQWVIYETHIRGLTIHPSSQVQKPGTFLGLIEKIPYLKSLGINAVELLPIFEFNEGENKFKNPDTGDLLCNFWGYSPVSFFCPMQRYASSNSWESPILEFKEMVRELHRNGIAVILDVVFNHTAEHGRIGPIISFKGLDPAAYYLFDSKGDYENFSGTGNTLNCNHPTTQKLILDALVYWAQEMQVDAFRFDLASIFTRGENGQVYSAPPILTAIEQEPLLQSTYFIAEAWDAAGLYQVGSFPGKKQRWSEWNGRFRDLCRCFIKGDPGLSGAFATAISGSQDLYSLASPDRSINFITAHDGYSLYDLVSYEKKHNWENGESNQDGANANFSWNGGIEGATEDKEIITLRNKQMKNLVLTLTLSLGIPMILMGDEYAHTRHGNNNPYCQDNLRNWFSWEDLAKNKIMFSFFQKAIAFRKKHAHLFCRKTFFTDQDISWHGNKTFHPDWNNPNNLVAYHLKNPEQNCTYYICFNASKKSVLLELPPPHDSRNWNLVVDTSLHSLYDFEEDHRRIIEQDSYELSSYSAMIARTDSLL